jgi:glycosyl transferase family 2
VFRWLRRARAGSEPDVARSNEADRLGGLATEAWVAGALPEAERLSRDALALAPELPALHYLLGAVLSDRGDHSGALAALEACFERRPDYPLAHHARVRAALCRMRTHLHEPPLEPMRGTAPMISVVICSITPAKFEHVTRNYSRLLADVPHEIVGIHDARSLSEGYNRGLRKARGDVLVFSHDDIEIHAPDFAAKLVNRLSEFDLIGVAGTDRVCGGTWLDAGWPHVFGQVGMRMSDGILAGTYVLRGASAAPMQGFDGLFFACRRPVLDAVAFDEATFDAWHLYDLDFTYSAFRAGFRLAVVNDLLIVHYSGGSFREQWLGYARKFMAKHGIAAPENYGYRFVEFHPARMRSVQEWRSFTHYVTTSPA